MTTKKQKIEQIITYLGQNENILRPFLLLYGKEPKIKELESCAFDKWGENWLIWKLLKTQEERDLIKEEVDKKVISTQLQAISKIIKSWRVKRVNLFSKVVSTMKPIN